MENVAPTTAYSLLDAVERQAVDNYVQFAINEQHSRRERIVHALYKPIPAEYIRKSRNALYRPLVLAAVREKIQEAANEQDLSPNRVIQEHAAIAFSDINDFIEPAGFGDYRVRDLDSIPPSKRGAVKSIECKPGPFGLHTKVVLHDKHPSLKAMGEMMGLVAPEKPPALLDYAKPPAPITVNEQEPEKAYAELLENVK